jgi:hypothetical protein
MFDSNPGGHAADFLFDLQQFATTPTPGPIRHELFESRPYFVDTTVNSGYYNAGDLCYWTGLGLASFGNGPLTLNAALVALLGKRLGVTKDTWPMSGGIIVPPQYAGIYQLGLFPFKSTSGDSYTNTAPVTIGADAQTITLAPVPAAPGATAVASGTGGTWSAAAHSVVYAYQTALGESTPSAATTVTTTSGQNIVVTLTSGYLPAYVTAINVYVDGIYAGSAPTTAAVTLAGPLTGIASTKTIPTSHALAIGVVELTLPIGESGAPPAIAGGSSVIVPVRYITKYPNPGLI